MHYAGPTQVQWHAKARINAGAKIYIVARGPAGMSRPVEKRDLYDADHGKKVLTMAPGLERLNILPFKYYTVLTSLDLDDLPDGGSGHFVETVKAMKKSKPKIMVECLSYEFRGFTSWDLQAVSMLANSGLDVLAHSIETVKRLQQIVRDP